MTNRFPFSCCRTIVHYNIGCCVFCLNSIESADLETETNGCKPVVEEEEEEEDQVVGKTVANLSPATSSASLYASEKFYSDAESDDDYKDPLPDFNPQSKSFHQV